MILFDKSILYLQLVAMSSMQNGILSRTTLIWGVNNNTHYYGIYVPFLSTEYISNNYGATLGITQSGSVTYVKKSSDNKTVYWYSENSAQYQFNKENINYYWLALT